MTEEVEHPSHYGGDIVYEPIKFINFWKLNFNLGSVIKYIVRAGRKTEDKIKDLEKARFYLDYEIQILKGEREV